MNKYSLDKDIEVKVDEDEKWAMEPEPEVMEEVDNVRLDPDAMARYLEIRKAREEGSRASGYHQN